jgi:hypothetical protein
VPVAATLNVAVPPTVVVWGAGCAEMDGATAVTVRIATLLTAVPAGLVTTQSYAPASARLTAAKFNVAVTADPLPVIGTPALRH